MKEPIKNFNKRDYPNGHIIQRYGVKAPIYTTIGLESHNGIDIVAYYGCPILAVEDGIVVEVQDKLIGYGLHVKVLSDENEWVFGHLSKINVILGQRVYAGDVIGEMGNSGSVTSRGIYQWGNANPDKKGTHLHLGLRKFKRLVGELSSTNTYNMQYSSGIRGTILNHDSGNKGAVDFYDMLPDVVAVEQLNFIVSLMNKTIELLKKLIALKSK